MRESCVLTRMSWFGIISKFMSPVTWPLNLICGCLFSARGTCHPNSRPLAVQMLKNIRSRWGYCGWDCMFQSWVLYVLISHCSPAPHISPQFLGRFDVLEVSNLTSPSCILRSFHPGRHVHPFGILTDEVGQLSFNPVTRKWVFSEHYSQL